MFHSFFTSNLLILSSRLIIGPNKGILILGSISNKGTKTKALCIASGWGIDNLLFEITCSP